MHQLNIVNVTGTLDHDPFFGKTGRVGWARIPIINKRTWRDRKTGQQREESTVVFVVIYGQSSFDALILSEGDRITV